MNITATLVTDLFAADVKPGVFKFYQNKTGETAGLNFICPCGCGDLAGVNINPPGWTWDGNREAPTLSPSIRRVDGCGWHGFLRAGQWESCGDWQPAPDELASGI